MPPKDNTASEIKHSKYALGKNPAFVEFQRKIRRHYEAIMATLENGLSNKRVFTVTVPTTRNAWYI